jgi:hypothetical protein
VGLECRPTGGESEVEDTPSEPKSSEQEEEEEGA